MDDGVNAGKRVLVTGGAGFVGSELVPLLDDRGYEVVVADDLSNPQSSPPDRGEFLEVDIGDPDAALRAFRGVDLCVALASRRGAIGYVHRHPTEILIKNNQIYEQTFRRAAEVGVNRLVFVSTSMVYERAEEFPTPEGVVEEIPPPGSVFGRSKLIGEWYCRTFERSHDLEHVIVRPSNIYGPDELPSEKVGDSHVIPDLFLKIRSGQHPLELLGDGRQTRAFVHVRDLARGLVRALEAGVEATGEAFNLGGPEEIEIRELARVLWELSGRDESFGVETVEGFPHDVPRQLLDISKAERLLGWEPRVGLREGLAEVVERLDAGLARTEAGESA